jgi:hypothetical protein
MFIVGRYNVNIMLFYVWNGIDKNTAKTDVLMSFEIFRIDQINILAIVVQECYAFIIFQGTNQISDNL